MTLSPKWRGRLKSVEEKVLDYLLRKFPQVQTYDQITRGVRKNTSAVMAVLERLYEKKLIKPVPGGLIASQPPKHRSLDSEWES